MIKAVKYVLLVIVLLLYVACKKNGGDSISTHTIHGQVYNLCTDSGMANITVYLKENGNTIAQMNSGTGGSFSFSNVQIHSNDEYVYELYIDSKSGIGDVGFQGDDEEIIKTGIDNPFTLYVVPCTLNWQIYFPASISASIYNDTFTLIVQQKIYAKNVPNGVNTLTMAIGPHTPPPL
ncbi:MAG: hypothetical protein JST67_03780 [Bacteroidetes bacterium]|nr:hypothetical protein [Bacteroidota bacterium]